MVGYLIFASASLLGYSGGFVVMTAFAVYAVRISWPTFVFLMYNFACVGVIAVFWQKVCKERTWLVNIVVTAVAANNIQVHVFTFH